MIFLHLYSQVLATAKRSCYKGQHPMMTHNIAMLLAILYCRKESQEALERGKKASCPVVSMWASKLGMLDF